MVHRMEGKKKLSENTESFLKNQFNLNDDICLSFGYIKLGY
jgi:hypothetical protein